MALNTPDSASEVIDRAVNDVLLSLDEFGGKPSLKNSWLNSLIVAYSNRVFDFYFSLDQAALECLPDTAVDNLERWAAIWGIQRIPGQVASGNIVATGTPLSTIPAGTVLTTGDGQEYETIQDETVTTLAQSVESITRSGTTATATTFDAHEYTDLVPVTITGATEPEYNVATEITVTGTRTFEYQVSGSPTTPATGSPSSSATTAVMQVESVEFSEDADQVGLSAFQFESPIVGVDETAATDFLGLDGGADQETDEALRFRLLDRIQNPVAHFNVADIRQQALTVPGVTRVFVFEITPSVGQVTVYFMRDLDETTAIPSGIEIDQVKAALDLIRPANTAPVDLIVLAPVPVPVDFTFTELVPNTSSMKDAVQASLAEFFATRTSLGVDVTEDQYRSAIFNTVDTSNGDVVQSFILSQPIGTIGINAELGQIATLGTVLGI